MVGSAPSERDSDLGFSNTSKNLIDFMDQFEQGTENGRYLTTDDLNTLVWKHHLFRFST